MKTIDLHGYTVEDAMNAAEKFVDNCFVEREIEAMIITGSGKIYHQVLGAVRQNPLVSLIHNDGPLGFKYRGHIYLELGPAP